MDLTKVPDNVLIDLALKDWENLELLCWAFTLDSQIQFEYIKSKQLPS